MRHLQTTRPLVEFQIVDLNFERINVDFISKEALSLLQYLLPGLLASWVFFGITPYKKPSPFERIIQALIFTLFIQGAIQFTNLKSQSCADKFSFSQLCRNEILLVILFALAFGVIFAILANKDWIHFVLRKLSITKQSSHQSVWYQILNRKVTYIVLHLNDGRRLYGWPQDWPDSPLSGHFYIVQASWLIDSGEDIYLPAANVDGILISASSVHWIEFMNMEQ